MAAQGPFSRTKNRWQHDTQTDFRAAQIKQSNLLRSGETLTIPKGLKQSR